MKQKLIKILKICRLSKLVDFLWHIKLMMHITNQRNQYDAAIAELQLAHTELVSPGNKERLDALENSHKGERCFIIGNGPSLKASDLKMLKEYGEFCFATNKISLIFTQTNWRPDVYFVMDSDFISSSYNEISQMDVPIKIATCRSIIKCNRQLEDCIYIPFLNTGPKNPTNFECDIRRGTNEYCTVVLNAVNMAVYMGFSEIYFLGVDNSIPCIRGRDGLIKIVGTNHFHPDYETECKIPDETIMSLDLTKTRIRMYKEIKGWCEAIGVKIYNATRGGELEVYERVRLEDVLNTKGSKTTWH